MLFRSDHLLADLTPGAAKTGALGNAALVEVVAARAKAFSFPLVVDPVMISKHGHPLIDASAVTAVKNTLLPVSFLLTPNTHEAAALTGGTVETLAQSKDAAKALAQLGARHVLVKGGHLVGAPIDVLLTDGNLHELRAERVDTLHTHGTGCTYSAAIVARLALGAPLLTAVTEAKAWLTRAIATAPGIGSGVGPVNHFTPLR